MPELLTLLRPRSQLEPAASPRLPMPVMLPETVKSASLSAAVACAVVLRRLPTKPRLEVFCASSKLLMVLLLPLSSPAT